MNDCLQKIEALKSLVYEEKRDIDGFRHFAPAQVGVLKQADIDSVRKSKQVVSAQDNWGRDGGSFIFQGEFTVPADWKQHTVALHLPLSIRENKSYPEALIYIDLEPLAAVDKNHQVIRLPEKYCDGRRHELLLDGWHQATGCYKKFEAAGHRMGCCEVVRINAKLQKFITKASVLVESASHISADNPPVADALMRAVEQSLQIIPDKNGTPTDTAITQACKALGTAKETAGVPLPAVISAIGHCHIDIAWLWSVQQARLKAGRSFYTVVHLMDQYDKYIFLQSQPQLYDYLRQDYPTLFERIKEKVRRGQWELTGGMWVEADCNISGAESLARQFLLGRRFFAEHFGKNSDSPVLWLPDVFGYTYALPQLMKLANVKYFFSTKLFWNDHNRLPFESFWWQGIDGTKVLSHCSCTPFEDEHLKILGTYNGMANAEDIYKTWQVYQQKDTHNEVITCFGYGDGGGGPTSQMLENLAELQNVPAMPVAKNTKAINFFEKMEKSAGDRLPVWNDELYLEFHRGTYTTQAHVKKHNRKSEIAMHNAELLASMAMMANKNFVYPQQQINDTWRLICLNQFHDILPGSSIREVYEQTQKDYEKILDCAAQICEQSIHSLSAKLPAADYVIFNPTSFEADNEPVLIENLSGNEISLTDADGNLLVSQTTEKGLLVRTKQIKPHAFLPLRKVAAGNRPVENPLKADKTFLENEALKVYFNRYGAITGIYDKEQSRDIIPAGAAANEFQLFGDNPKQFDAWELDIDYEKERLPLNAPASIHVVEQGPLRAMLKITRPIGDSHMTQYVSIVSNSKLIRFDTRIDWHEQHKLLKVAFPVTVHANQATYDIQWGNIKRSTQRNTSWEKAKFEVPAHKWADLSDDSYGVSLLNDCKYGYDIKDNIMRLTLLRAPAHPDPSADQGTHEFTYALLPHQGTWCRNTEYNAYLLNNPLKAFPVKASSQNAGLTAAFVSTDCANVIVETVKKTEDENALIVRLYESQAKKGRVAVKCNFDFTECLCSNLLEEDISPLHRDGRTVFIDYRPYQIICLKLKGI